MDYARVIVWNVNKMKDLIKVTIHNGNIVYSNIFKIIKTENYIYFVYLNEAGNERSYSYPANTDYSAEV